MNLAYCWFWRLELQNKVPDHSSFSKNQHCRVQNHDAFRQLFDSVLLRCMAEGLVRGERFATGASMTKADVNRQRNRLGYE
jgi:transposase